MSYLSGSMLPIEKNQVLPAYGMGHQHRYPWHQLNISVGDPPRGDSFFVQRSISEIHRAWNSLTSCARSVERKTGKKFVMRRVNGGIRVWRVK